MTSLSSTWKTCLVAVMLGLSPTLNATEQSHEAIYQAVIQHIEQRLQQLSAPPQVEVSELDRRLTLSQCREPLQTYDPPSFRQLGRTSVGVRCPDDTPWSLFVTAHVTANLPVVVTRHALSRGAILQASDLTLQTTSSDKIQGDYLTHIDQALGKRLRRNLNSGAVVGNGMLLTPKAVKYGNQVTLVNRVGGLEVRMKGKAMGQGSIGERIAVKNLSSKRTVEGIIRSTDLVEVQ